MATYYWVGGTGTWDGSSKTNWATLSGGAGGNGPPTSADVVNFDTNSGTGTCTTASGSASAIVTFNSATVGLTLGANHTATGGFTLTQGSINLNSKVLSCTAFASSNTNTRSIDFGSGNITLTGNAGTIWTTATDTSLTITGTAVVNCTYSGSTGTRNLTNGAATASTKSISVNVSAGSDIVTINNFNNINFTGFSGTLGNSARSVYGNMTFSSGMTCTAGTNATNFVATSGTQQIATNGNLTIDFPIVFSGVGGTFQLQDNCTVGSTRTVTLTNGALDLNNNTLSCGLFSSSNSNTRSIAFGTGNITLTGSATTVWTTNTATGLTVSGTPLINCTYSGSTGTRAINMNNIGGSESNAISIKISAGSDAFQVSALCKDLDFTGFSGTLNNNARSIYGNLTISSGMTCAAGTAATTFAATSGTKTITTNGQTLDLPLTFNGVGGTWSFADALTQGSTRAFTITNGTVKLKAGVTSTVGAFATSGSNQKYLQSTTAGSQATLSQASGTVTVSYLSIKDIAATGGATWNAYVDYNNVDQGDNTGWDFSYSPAIDNEFPVALRSFTQPKRF